MTFDFSIESSSEKIQNINTKDYFKEVYQTFVNGNYRSSIVMLYSVLICDLVYKLRDLRDIYAESKAKKILDEIELMQIANPNSPEWESKLIEFIKVRTTLLEPSDIVAIESLQKFRHLSAHPVLNNSDLLYSPNKDTVQALIRNILEGVLTNPPFFSNKIFDTMLLDLAEVKDKITDDENLNRYVNSRYIKRLKENDFKKVYRSLWKVVFMTIDKDSVENLNINYRVLRIFTSHDKTTCVQLIKNETTYYSNINKDEKIGALIHFLASYPELFNKLEHPLKLLIETKIKGEVDYYFMGWFTRPTLVDHIKSLDFAELNDLGEITDDAFNYIKKLSADNSCTEEITDFAIDYFGNSYSFDNSQKRFKRIILNIVDQLSLEQTEKILELSDDNNQIFQSFGMRAKLQTLAEKYEGKFDPAKYRSIYQA